VADSVISYGGHSDPVTIVLTMNDGMDDCESARMWKWSWHISHDNFQSGYPVPGPRFEPGTFRCGNRSLQET